MSLWADHFSKWSAKSSVRRHHHCDLQVPHRELRGPPFSPLVKQRRVWLTSRSRGGGTFTGDQSSNLATTKTITISPDIQLSPIQSTVRNDIIAHLQIRDISRHTLLIPHPLLPEHADQWLPHVRNDVTRSGRETIWAIRASGGRKIGAVELPTGGPGKQHCAELGYWLAKPFWGRGIMTAVVKLVVELGFREFGVLRIIALIFTVNQASACVLENAGFVIEAPLLRKHYHRDGQFFDRRLYARVRDD